VTGTARATELRRLLAGGDPQASLVARVCEVSSRLLGVTGAGMCLIGGRRQQVIVHGTDPLIAELEDLQVVLGQGPCVEAVRSGTAVLVPELLGHDAVGWQALADQALARGVRALFSIPLLAGTARIGALDLYRLFPGPLDPRQLDDARILTEIASAAMLAQADRDHPDGSVTALHWLSDPDAGPAPGSWIRSAGPVVDLGTTVGESLAELDRGRRDGRDRGHGEDGAQDLVGGRAGPGAGGRPRATEGGGDGGATRLRPGASGVHT